ncbi:MAG: iron-sulfur cluster assembly scaffold protein [Tsuneonella sp.]
MSAGGQAALYTPELLALAVSLAGWPLDPGLPHQGEARSRSCGSTLRFGCETDGEGRIRKPGVRVAACAVGQASAAIFVADTEGRDAADLARALDETERWVAGTGPQPDWPGIDAIAPALGYPGRHGAILLPWRAACAALCNHGAGS